MYSEEQVQKIVESSCERAVREALPDATKQFARAVSKSITDMGHDIKDKILSHAAESGDIDPETGDAKGNTSALLALTDHIIGEIVNHLLESKMQVITSEEELEFHKSMQTFTDIVGGESDDA